ncbi:TrlF family AAA-like ATPase [Flavobacterium sp.]|uniref:TrlF family AAA-like ATPase n=1 Tax=Flavobacterium sp. TaxID=239 RepID=UPI003340B18B
MTKIERGSEWRKWDLHIHTPASFYWNGTKKYKELGVEEKDIEIKTFIETVNKSDVSVFCLMDYWTFDFYFDLKDYLNKHPNELKKTVFPGMELRVESPTSYRLNIHFILSNELTKQQLLDFKSELIIRSIGRKLSDDALIQFARTLDASKAKIHSFSDPKDLDESQLLLLGSQTAEITKESLEAAFEQIPQGSGFIILPYDTSDGLSRLDWKKHPHADNYFMQSTHIFESRDKCNIDLFNGIMTDENESYFENFYKTLGEVPKPCISGSDAHKYSDYGKYPSDKITWIKADPTFEGLKQIIYEPTERVRIQKEQPEAEKLDNLMIEEVSFESSNKKFTPEPIKLNKNLNVIIGGKSSGKSILLYKMARTLYANTNDEVLKYIDSEDGKTKDLYDLSSNDSAFNFKVKLFSGSSQSLKDRIVYSSILPSIKYIPQNHLSNLVDKSRKNGATLKELIRNLILEEPLYKKKYDEFVETVKKNDEQRNRDIDYYFQLKEEIVKKENELSSRGDTKSLQEGIESNKKKIASLSKSFSPEDLKKYNELVAQKNLANVDENNLNIDYEKIKNFNSDLKRILNEQLIRKRIVVESINTDSIKEQFEQKYKFIEKTLEEINSIEKDLLKNGQGEFITDSKFKKEVNRVTSKKQQLDSELKPYIEKQENSKQIEAIQKSISDDETKLSEIKQFQNEVLTKRKSLNEQKNKIFNDFEINFRQYSKIIDELKPRISSIKGDDDKVEIFGSVKYNFKKFRGLIQSISDGRSFNNNDFKYIYDEKKNGLSAFEYSKVKEDLMKLFEKIEGKKYVLLSSINSTEACKKIMTDLFFDHWDVKSDNDDIHKMSTGKASFILLKLIIKLSKEKGPILIDQPEDNLDNRSVSKELVRYLKSKKVDRQIILVTHNPNIVVNADAENIIVANQKGQNDVESNSPYTFDYINGSLENSFPINTSEKDLLKSMGIREHIAEIVEGGKEAFKKREVKYGFQ